MKRTHSTRRRSRPPVRRPLERLEERTLLSLATGPGHDLTSAVQLRAPADVQAGWLAADTPAFYRIAPTADSLLMASVHADRGPTRLLLLDSGGDLLVQSDGQSPANPDDLINQHLVAGTFYLEVQSLGSAGSFTISVELSSASQPDQPAISTVPVTPLPPPPPINVPPPPPINVPPPSGLPPVSALPSIPAPASPLPPSTTELPPLAAQPPGEVPAAPLPPSTTELPPLPDVPTVPLPPLPPGLPVADPVPRPPDVLGLAAGGLPKVFGDFRGNGILDYVGA